MFFSLIIIGAGIALQSSRAFSAMGDKSTLTSAFQTCVHTPNSSPYAILQNPLLNKGISFTPDEREQHELDGLIPAGEALPLSVKVNLAMQQLQRKTSSIEKYIFLHSIQDSDETLFYAMLLQNLQETMPIVYTPTVGQACQEWSTLYNHRQVARGIYLTTKNLGKIPHILRKYRNRDIEVIVVTDGERILGLGDLGANGMGIPIGKLALYTACAGIPPEKCLPVVLDVGTNTASIREDIAYIGLRQPRDRSEQYDRLVEEFFDAAQEVYGKHVLIQFEDFGNQNAFRLLEKYRNRATTFNDDIQGTAAVTLAGLYASLPLLSQKSLAEHRFLFYGAGEAGVGIADLISTAIAEETGKSLQDAREHSWFVDSKGLITSKRDFTPLEHHKLAYAHHLNSDAVVEDDKLKQLVDIIAIIRPTVIIGVSAQGGAFSEAVIKEMLKYSVKPVIFALSNPTTKAECTAEQAYTWTNGSCVFASGSPFGPVVLSDGRKFTPGQGNNAYIFPGVGLGALISKATSITDDDFLVAAKALASYVSPARLTEGACYPLIEDIRTVSKSIAAKVAANVQSSGRSAIVGSEEEKDWEKVVEETMYSPKY